MLVLGNIRMNQCQNCNAQTLDVPGWVKLKDIPKGINIKKHICSNELTNFLKEFSVSLLSFEKRIGKRLCVLRDKLVA